MILDAVELELGDEPPTALYRLYAADGALLYIGITANLKDRMAQHAADKPWWGDVTRKTVAWYPLRSEAMAAELSAIRVEHPRHNVVGTAGTTPPLGEPPAISDALRQIETFIQSQMEPAELRYRIGRLVWPTLSAREVADRLGFSRATRFHVQALARKSRKLDSYPEAS